MLILRLGRVNAKGFIPDTPHFPRNRDTADSSAVPLPPDDVLFRRKRAPTRYEEDDFYWADRYLTSEQRLPDSDLLKSIHSYATDLYAHGTEDEGHGDYRSMDETALLALGILLEEAADHVLGEAGDMVFVEGEKDDSRESGSRNGHVPEAIAKESSVASHMTDQPWGRKRRKIGHIRSSGSKNSE